MANKCQSQDWLCSSCRTTIQACSANCRRVLLITLQLLVWKSLAASGLVDSLRRLYDDAFNRTYKQCFRRQSKHCCLLKHFKLSFFQSYNKTIILLQLQPSSFQNLTQVRSHQVSPMVVPLLR